MAWDAPQVAVVTDRGLFVCVPCAEARELTGEPVHGDYWPALDDVCEYCGVQPPHVSPCDYVRIGGPGTY